MRFFRCEGHCQRFRNTRVSLNLTPESVWLMCMFLFHACSHGYVQSISRYLQGVQCCLDSSCLEIWIHWAYCLLFLQLWAVVGLKLQFLTLIFQDNLLQYFHYISSNRALSQFVFFFFAGVHCAKKNATILLSEFWAEAAEALMMNVDFQRDVPMLPGRFG